MKVFNSQIVVVVLLLIASVTTKCVAQEYHLRPPAGPVPKTLFGLHIHKATKGTPWPPIEFGSLRLWDSGVTWADLEPQKGKWNFTMLDDYITLAEKHGVDVLLPIGTPPSWASSRPEEPPDFRKGSAAEPRNIDDFSEYVRTLAARYKGRVHNWELWNEPNLKQFYTGDIPHMVQLQKVAYEILSRSDPENRLTTPSPTGDYTGPSWIQSFLSGGGGHFANIVGFHLYVSPKGPEAMVPLVQKIQRVMADENVLAYKPLWDTETGWFIESSVREVKGTSIFPVVRTEDAAGYVARAFTLAWASGVSRLYWYDWDSATMALAEDGKDLKPAARAYGEIEKWLVGAAMRSCDSDRTGIWTCQIVRDGGYSGYIVWSPQGVRNYAIPGSWNVHVERDLAGGAHSVAGNRNVDVGVKPILLENKNP